MAVCLSLRPCNKFQPRLCTNTLLQRPPPSPLPITLSAGEEKWLDGKCQHNLFVFHNMFVSGDLDLYNNTRFTSVPDTNRSLIISSSSNYVEGPCISSSGKLFGDGMVFSFKSLCTFKNECIWERRENNKKKTLNSQGLTSEGGGRKNNNTFDQTWPRLFWLFWSVFRNGFHFPLSTLSSSKQNSNRQLASDSVTLIGLLSPDECIFLHFCDNIITYNKHQGTGLWTTFPFGRDDTSWSHCLAASRFMQLNPIYFCLDLCSIHRGREWDWEGLCRNNLL